MVLSRWAKQRTQWANALGLTPANQGYLLLVFAGCWLGGVFDGLDSALMHVTMPLALAELTGQPAQAVAHWGGIITAVFLLGWTLGGLLLGYVGDRFGRVKAMLISIVVYSLFTGLGGLAQTPLQLACFRFLTGIGIGGELVSITAFLSEVWPPKSKGLATALLITSYQVGQLLAGALNYWLADWRYAFFVGALPALLTFALRRNLKESDAWLANHHALEAKQGGALPATVWLRQWLGTLFASENTRNLWVGSVAFGAYLTVTWASMAWIPSWLQGLAGHPADIRPVQIMVQGVCALVGCGVGGYLTLVWGAKRAIVLGTLGILGASFALFYGYSQFHPSLYAVGGVYGFFHGLTQSSFYAYVPSLFPTPIRMGGTGFCFNAGRILTAVAVLFMGPLVQVLGGYGPAAMAFAYCGLVSVAALCFAKPPRTSPQPMA
jgi:MFS family permease